jgi:hypothetical protein
MVPCEDLNSLVELQIKKLKSFQKFSQNFEKCIRGISMPMKKWLGMSNGFFDKGLYLQKEQKYVYYKKKLTRLISNVEHKACLNKEIKNSKLTRIERVRRKT